MDALLTFLISLARCVLCVKLFCLSINYPQAGLNQFIGKKLASVGLDDYDEEDDPEEEGGVWDMELVDDFDEEEQEFMDGVDEEREQTEEEEAEEIAALLKEVKNLTARDLKLGKTSITKVH